MTLDGRTIGLALSGGGFRATLFGLGSLWRLNEAGLLGRLDRISSVSGGSILSGLLAHRWRRLDFADGSARNFKAEVVAPIRALCDKTIDVSAGIKGVINPFKSAGEYLADCYDKHLFHAHFSDRGRLFQADRGRCFSAIVDARGMRASEEFNVSQSSTISLKRGVDGPLSRRPQGGSWGS